MADDFTTSPPDQRLLVESLDGPGKSGRPLELKGKIRNVARLSKQSKTVLFGLAALLVGGILVGTLTAGHNTPKAASADNSGADSVGTVAPDVMPARPAANPFNASPVPAAAASAASDGKLTPRGSDPLNPAGAQGNGTAPPLTPAQQHQAWLVQQHYKRLEGQILAGDAAVTAEIGKGGVAGLMQTQTAGAEEAGGGTQRLADAQAAALKLMVNHPQAAQATDMRNLLNALAASDAAATNGAGANIGGTGDGTGQAANQQFLADAQKTSLDGGYLPALEQPRASAHELFAGSVIPAVLVSGIDSDLPGVISAQVRQTVYDSLNPNVVLIPQGTKLIGQYSSAVAYGQNRVLAAWRRLIFPNGATIDLEGMSAADGQGRSGLNDQVDNHTFRTFGSAILMSLLGVGAQLSQPQNSGAFNTPPAGAQAASALATSLNQTGALLLQKNLQVQPTLKIRSGYTFNVMVNRTMILPPYQSR